MFAGSVVVGESFNAATALAAARTAGVATTVTGAGLVEFSLLTDALGQRAGSSANAVRKLLTTPLAQAGAGGGISKGRVEGAIAAGFRTEQGLTLEQERALGENLPKFVRDFIIPRLEAGGVNLEDRAAVRKFLRNAGANETAERALLEIISARDEYEKASKTVDQFADTTQLAITNSKNMNAALETLAVGFNDLSSSVLVPLLETTAPAVASLGRGMQDAAMWLDSMSESQRHTVASITALGTTAAGAAVAVGGVTAGFRLLAPLVAAGSPVIAGLTLLGAAATGVAKILDGIDEKERRDIDRMGREQRFREGQAKRASGLGFGFNTDLIDPALLFTDKLARDYRAPAGPRQFLGPNLPGSGTPNITAAFQAWANATRGAGLDRDNILGPLTAGAAVEFGKDLLGTIGTNLQDRVMTAGDTWEKSVEESGNVFTSGIESAAVRMNELIIAGATEARNILSSVSTGPVRGFSRPDIGDSSSGDGGNFYIGQPIP
ncbi:hypothetical protein [Paracoccus methylarcula]|uniref:Phage tail tape measure protein n=1 Tax=Paracoccus methylarcula TaxID=72022 RepID=A0A422QZE2_9RHOB|nr:hypothetical protein [Paracoccus methylarcula]RNF35336.1 hypothetical protein A7A09_007000 [Paracoccus methylarcula]